MVPLAGGLCANLGRTDKGARVQSIRGERAEKEPKCGVDADRGSTEKTAKNAGRHRWKGQI